MSDALGSGLRQATREEGTAEVLPKDQWGKDLDHGCWGGENWSRFGEPSFGHSPKVELTNLRRAWMA